MFGIYLKSTEKQALSKGFRKNPNSHHSGLLFVAVKSSNNRHGTKTDMINPLIGPEVADRLDVDFRALAIFQRGEICENLILHT
jgi:hypothetical protein